MVSIGVQDKAAMAVGATGPQGIQGPPGPATTIGATGPIGLQGETGPRGEKGIQGDTGLIGPPGKEGSTGPTGPAGGIGPTGVIGPEGNIGPRGCDGAQGESGPIGPTGNTGEMGPEGPTGPQGPPGPATTIGATGVRGPITPAGVYFSDNMTTLLKTTITGTMTRTGQASFAVPSEWSETTNAYLQASMSVKLPPIATTVTFRFMYAVGNSKIQELCKIYTRGSDQLLISGFIPNVAVGDSLYVLFNTQIDEGECDILDFTPVSGAIYHVS